MKTIKLKNGLIYNEDSREVLKTLKDNSVEAIVTDPPYEIGFMGKKWDNTGIAFDKEFWEECLRVLKSGGHLLAFSAARTYHRMAVAIEDAGFEIRDMIEWVYGSGFPKSHNISKAIDKKLGKEREVLGIDKIRGKSNKSLFGKADPSSDNYDGTTLGVGTTYITAPASPEAKEWDGWGTALKPAHEPIVLARKPIAERTIADNVLKHGTGGINIDGTRIGTGTGEEKIVSYPDIRGDNYNQNKEEYKNRGKIEKKIVDSGRFPANFIISSDVAPILDKQSGFSKEGKGGVSRYFKNIEDVPPFHYCPKASKKERTASNNHPTVKPLKLIEYLLTLVVREGQTVLDPFFGSGTTGVAATNKGFKFIGIELEEEYVDICESRIKAAEKEQEEKTA